MTEPHTMGDKIKEYSISSIIVIESFNTFILYRYSINLLQQTNYNPTPKLTQPDMRNKFHCQ